MRNHDTDLASSTGGRGQVGKKAGISLQFDKGHRPSIPDIGNLLVEHDLASMPLRISHRPADEEGWVELLASGLTFDLTGLSPAAPSTPPQQRHLFGFEVPPVIQSLEAIGIKPGSHLAGGASMAPVVRTMLGIAANIGIFLPVRAICWHPAESWMEPRYFSRIVLNWLNGGAFPALGLTALTVAQDGSVASEGLEHFIGQEIRIQARAGERPADTVKLAVRIIDYLVRNGPITEPHEIKGATELLTAEPSKFGNSVWVWRTG